ncbi:MAG: putative dipeptide ABC transporter substrate-binding protein [Spirochaetes bacterium]|nr:MAG: putative dipeptide ABC transporter substrate-binding protein [Spirochaetota bacterium]
MKKVIAILFAALILGTSTFAQAKGPALRNRDPETLVFVLAAVPQPLDPNIYTTLNEAQIMREINETLMGMTPDYKFYPMLAEVVPTLENGLVSKDGSIYTLKLRKGVKFHNGNEFNADDVVFSFNRILHHPKSSSKSMFSSILSVEKVDSHTVKITWGRLRNPEDATVPLTSWADRAKYMVASPYGPALNILAHYCSGIEDKETVEAAGADYGTKVVTGTGPYKFVSWPNPQEVNVTRNDAWWGDAKTLAFKNIQFRAMSEQPQVNNVLITGEVDMAFNLSRLDTKSIEKAGINITSKPGLTIWYGVFNMNSNLVGQKMNGKLDLSGAYTESDTTKLRRAIFYSINSVPFIRQVDLFNGHAIPANQMMQPGFLGHVTSAPAGSPFAEFNERSWYFNRDKAKAEFASISPEFKAKLVPESITLVVGNITDRVKIANNVKDQVKTTLGVDLIKVIPMVNAQIIQMSKTGDGYDMVVTGWFTPTGDPDYTCIIYNGDSIGTGMNGALYNNDIVNANIATGRYTQDQAARKVAYDKVQTQLMTDKPYFPMVYENVLFGTHPRVGNIDRAIFGTKLVDLHLLTKQF